MRSSKSFIAFVYELFLFLIIIMRRQFSLNPCRLSRICTDCSRISAFLEEMSKINSAELHVHIDPPKLYCFHGWVKALPLNHLIHVLLIIEILFARRRPNLRKHPPEQSSSSLSGKIPVKDRGDIVNSFNREGSGPQVSIKWIKSFI